MTWQPDPGRNVASLADAERMWPEAIALLDWSVPHLSESGEMVVTIMGRNWWGVSKPPLLRVHVGQDGVFGFRRAIWHPDVGVWVRNSFGVSSRPRRPQCRPYPVAGIPLDDPPFTTLSSCDFTSGCTEPRCSQCYGGDL